MLGRGGYQAVVRHGTSQGRMGNGCVFLTDPRGNTVDEKIQPSDVCLDMSGSGSRHSSGQGQLGRHLDHPDSGKMSPLCRGQLRIKDHR